MTDQLLSVLLSKIFLKTCMILIYWLSPFLVTLHLSRTVLCRTVDLSKNSQCSFSFHPLFPVPSFCSSRAFFYRKCDAQEQFTVKLAFPCLFQHNLLTWQMKATPTTSSPGSNPTGALKSCQYSARTAAHFLVPILSLISLWFFRANFCLFVCLFALV